MADDPKVERLYVEPADQVTAENIHTDPETQTEQLDKRAAVKLVLNDTERADNFINMFQWASGWTLADTLLQSPQTYNAFQGSSVAQANVPKFMLSNHMNSIVPKIMGGLFYDDPPFLLRPLPGTDQEVVRAKTALFAAQLQDMKFEEESEKFIEQQALFGTGIAKWGYLEYTKKKKNYQRKQSTIPIVTSVQGPPQMVDTPESDQFEVKYIDELISRPWFKTCDLRTVLVDPGCRTPDIREAKWVVYRDYVTYNDLEMLRGVEGYDIPDSETLKLIFTTKPDTPPPDNIALTIPENMWGYLQHALPRNYKTTADPLQWPLEILERWDRDKVIVVLHCNQHNILIRNEVNPYEKIPFFSANWRNLPDCFYGQGLGILIGSEQIVEQGVTNLALDLLAYGLQPTAVRKKGFNATTQNVRWKVGGIIDVDEDVDKAFKFLEMPGIPGEAWTAIQQAQNTGAASSGANEQVIQGAASQGIKTTGMRSGTGAAAVVQANASRLDGPAGRFVRQVFIPWLYQMDELNNQLLPTSVLRKVLGEELGNTYQIDHQTFRNANVEYEVLAGAHLGSKREMAQFLPIGMQVLTNPIFAQAVSDSGYKFDAVAFFQMFADIAGWKYANKFIRRMTPQEQQQAQQRSPAGMQQSQLQAQSQMQDQKFKQQQVLQSENQMGRAANEVMRRVLEDAITPQELTGEPGGQGFGSEANL